MKKIIAGLLLCTCTSLVALATTHKEVRTVIFTPGEGAKTRLLNPSEGIICPVTFQDYGYPTRKMLRVVGEIKMPVPFSARGEEMFRRAEYLIDDNLDSVNVKYDRYSLYFKGENNNFERHAYYRIPGSVLKSGDLTVKIPVKRSKLFVPSDADFGVEMELFYKKEGRHPDDIYDKPDSVLFFSIPQGSGKFQNITRRFKLPDNVACILLRVGGTQFSGECWAEAPRLIQNGKVVCTIPFTRFNEKESDYNYWVGCNLSTRSWPMWKLDYNGKTVFYGNIFDRASNVADFYIPLPEPLDPDGELKLTLVKEPHRAAYPYELRSLEIIEESARDFEVISVPKYVSKESAFGVLVETNKPDVTLKINAPKGIVPVQDEVTFKEKGLHVIEFKAGEAAANLAFSIAGNGRSEQLSVQQIIDKAADNVYISSGDEIHIDKKYAPYDYFFKWYMSNRIGNWYQFRPSYQWSGFRVVEPEIITHYTGLLNQLQVPYAWQAEGRTLAAKRINPDVQTLASPMFRGKQAHENDGGYYYWQHFLYQGMFSDMAARNRPYGGIFAKHRPIYTDHGIFIHYDPYGVKDMADGAAKLVANFNYSKGESTRHTGPSTLFRYLYQAGYDWLGAEQMYGPEEIILSSLRGASRAYGKTDYGTLHAMQWGSFPFTDPKHSLRLYMSLAVAYMHGSSHINTEEALWIDEYANDRYTESGKQHLKAQYQVLDFIETHTRRGTFKTDIAVIQGRNDAWKSFGRGSLWSQKGDKWAFNSATESFDLLKIFYPDNIVDGCGPNGWFTATPYGPIDLLPVEASLEVMNQYKMMIFLGWNTFDEADFGRIRDFVKQGGTLILSAAHLNSELQPDKPVVFPAKDAVIREMLGNDYQSFDTKKEIKFGNGKIVYFPQKAYPIENTIRKEYESTIRNTAFAIIGNEPLKGWVASSPSVGFTAWDNGTHRTLYLLNTDWQSDKQQQPATFVYGSKKFPVEVRRYMIESIHCADGVGLMPKNNTTDVLEIKKTANGWNVTVQNTEADTLTVFNSHTGKVESIAIKEAGVHNLTVR